MELYWIAWGVIIAVALATLSASLRGYLRARAERKALRTAYSPSQGYYSLPEARCIIDPEGNHHG